MPNPNSDNIVYTDDQIDAGTAQFMDIFSTIAVAAFIVSSIVKPILNRSTTYRLWLSGPLSGLTSIDEIQEPTQVTLSIAQQNQLIAANLKEDKIAKSVYTDPRYGFDSKLSLLLLQISMLLDFIVAPATLTDNWLGKAIFFGIIIAMKVSVSFSNDLAFSFHLVQEGCYSLWFHMIANFILPILVLPLTIRVLLSSEDYFSFVGNTVSVYFIMELDEFVYSEPSEEICEICFRKDVLGETWRDIGILNTLTSYGVLFLFIPIYIVYLAYDMIMRSTINGSVSKSLLFALSTNLFGTPYKGYENIRMRNNLRLIQLMLSPSRLLSLHNDHGEVLRSKSFSS